MNDFYLEKNIYYHDTDAGGVVYYGSYLKHLEESRAECMKDMGIDFVAYAKNGFIFPVVHLEIDYRKPARYGDRVRIFTWPEVAGKASLEFRQEIRIGDKTLLVCKVVCACVNRDLKPTRLPEYIVNKLTP